MKGGYRPGAGRKKGYAALEAEKAREYIARRVVKALRPIVDSHIKKARAGDIRSTMILFERAFGRVSTAQESVEAYMGDEMEEHRRIISTLLGDIRDVKPSSN